MLPIANPLLFVDPLLAHGSLCNRLLRIRQRRHIHFICKIVPVSSAIIWNLSLSDSAIRHLHDTTLYWRAIVVAIAQEAQDAIAHIFLAAGRQIARDNLRRFQSRSIHGVEQVDENLLDENIVDHLE